MTLALGDGVPPVGQLLGSYRNPETEVDYQPYLHTWPGVELGEGSILRVESKPHNNGKIPEKGETAWARGRWSGISLSPSEGR